jgi:hypothetical protein
MVEVEEGLYRVTFSLPLGIDHVHCYLVRSSSGFILVDTGLGGGGGEGGGSRGPPPPPSHHSNQSKVRSTAFFQ